MVIRKEFRVESAHIVRNCTSDRCSHSIHGHSAVIELFFESNKLDNAQMVMDFGLMKNSIKQFIDSMDHCYLLCSEDSTEFRDFISRNCKRFIILPFNPSAEMLSLFIFRGIANILHHTTFKNGESGVRLKAVRYHETTTGYAECTVEDIITMWNPRYDSVMFSLGVIEDWSDSLKSCIFEGATIINPEVKQQINLHPERQEASQQPQTKENSSETEEAEKVKEE